MKLDGMISVSYQGHVDVAFAACHSVVVWTFSVMLFLTFWSWPVTSLIKTSFLT